MPEETIRIVTYEPEPTSTGTHEGRKDPTSMAGSYCDERPETVETAPRLGGISFHEIEAEKLEAELAQLMQILDRSIARAAQQANMQFVDLSEVEVALAMTANGSLSILGFGAGISGSTSISLKLKPKP